MSPTSPSQDILCQAYFLFYDDIHVTLELQRKADYLKGWFMSPPGSRVPGLVDAAGESETLHFPRVTLGPWHQSMSSRRA